MVTYKEQLKNLSATLGQNTAVQTALANIDVGLVITQIGDKYDLTLEEIGHLYDVVGQVLTGEIKAAAFAENIKNRIDSFNWKHLDDLVNDLNREIFLKVRGAMRVGTQPTTPSTPTKTTAGSLWPSVNPTAPKIFTPPNLPTEDTEQENYATQKELLEQIENPQLIEALNPKPQVPNKSQISIQRPEQGSTFTPPPAYAEATAGRQGQTLKTPQPNLPTTSYTLPASNTFSFTPPAKTRPESGSLIPPTPKPAVPNKPSIVGDRLTKTVVAPKEQKTYTVDPYRESPK